MLGALQRLLGDLDWNAGMFGGGATMLGAIQWPLGDLNGYAGRLWRERRRFLNEKNHVKLLDISINFHTS
jgi:hypothetical protein